jgi:hypothetical protein
VLAAAAWAGAVSGVPSTLHALASGRSPLAAARAAGELLGRPGLIRGGLAHAAVSLWWGAVLAAAPLPRPRAVSGAVAGLVIGLVDLAVADRRFPEVAALPRGPQLADHAVFGAVAASVGGGAGGSVEVDGADGAVRGWPG